MILEADNLIEFFSYVYNNYPETSYKSIFKCKIDTESELYEAIVQFDNQTSIITIEKDNYPKFNINSKVNVKDGISQGINIQVSKLFSDIETRNNILSAVNRVLLNDICDYIEEVIKPYYDNKETNDGIIEGSVLGISIEDE